MNLIKRFIYKLKFYFYLKNYLKIMRLRKNSKNKISTLKSKILDLNYNFDKYFTKRIFENLPISYSIFFKQYNFLRLIRPEKINLYILNIKKFNFPLTSEQIKFLKNNGYILSNFISHLLFFLFCIKEFFRGIIIFLIINFISISKILKKNKINKNKLFIHSLRVEQIESFKKVSTNLESWIRNKFEIYDHSIVHNNKHCKNLYTYNKLFLPELNKLSELLKFNFIFFKYFFLILLDFSFLRIKQISIFSEIVKLCCALSKEKNSYINDYFFFSQLPFFRPLYTYCLGRNVFFIENHISTNPSYFKDGTKDLQTMWKNLTWDNYLVWNDNHKNFIKNNQIIEAKYFISGPISFGTSNVQNLKNKIPESILVFDSVPFRKSFISNYNVYAATYHEDNIIKFLNDIYKLNDKFMIYIKPKRNQVAKIYSKKYNKYLKNNNKFKILNPGYSPKDIVCRFDKVICLPFSSTAWIAKNLNKKVCFYDVVGLHQDFGNTFDNIRIIRNFSELQKWSEN